MTGNGNDAGTGGETGSTDTEGGTPADDSGASASCTGGHIRGPAPTTASAAAMTGPYTVKSYAADATVRKTNAYDVTSAHIYYPTNATPPFAGVAIVPGFTAAESSIAAWAPFLASNGILVMTIGTSNPTTGAGDTSVLPPVRSDALEDALTTIKGENTRQGSPLVGLVDTARLATAGWSMGGGGTLIAAAAHPENKATMAMAPWNPGGTYPMMTVPTLIFGGTSDGLAGPPAPQSQYMSIPETTPKLVYVVTGGSHFVANTPAGESGKYDIGRFGLSWMKVYLECDDRYRQFLPVKPSDADTFETDVK